MRTFVMGDIHGTYQALVKCLELSGFNKKKDRLIQLGDIIDRGPDSFECVEELLTIKNLVAIRGNHDAWFREFIDTGHHPSDWSDGGNATIVSYLKHRDNNKLIKRTSHGSKTGLHPKDIPESHQQFFVNQVLYFIDDDNNCFVHGGFDRHNSFHGQQPQLYFYDRQLWSDAMMHLVAGSKVKGNKDGFYIKTSFNSIFIGHTPTLNWKTDRPMKIENIYNIDTGAGHGGRLTIMNVETKEFFQSDPIHNLVNV